MIDKTLINSGEVIAVALSGGKDSVCLLDLLLNLRNELNITIKAVHIDHSIRGEDSVNDASFAKKYCESLGVEAKIFKVDAPLYSKQNGLSLEQGARALRYQIFNELLEGGFCDKIATAHHKNDSFESVLFNLFRGTGLKGVSGIPKQNGKIIRPLLNLTREEIEEYIKQRDLPFVQDKTNFASKYDRNYIRNQIIPTVVDRFPSAVDSAIRFSQIAKEEDEYLDSIALSIIEVRGEKLYIPLTENNVLIKRAVIIALNRLGVSSDYQAANLEQVLSLKNLQSGAKITLPKGVVAIKEYDYAVLYKTEDEKLDIEYPYSVGKFTFGSALVEITKDGGALKFDGSKIPDGAVIRTRRDGDIFTKFGGGTKKLKEFFIDKKIPLSKRDFLPLIAKGNVVYLIFGVEICDDIKVTSKTQNILYANIKAD